MFDHDLSFLELAKMIIEGKEPPKKDKVEKDLKKDGKESAEETLAKVKKDLGVSDDKSEDGEDQAKKVDDTGKEGGKKGNEDGSTDTDDHPDNPASTGDGDEQPEAGAPQDPPKKDPKKPDVSKDPFKGDKDGGKKDAKKSPEGSGTEDSKESPSAEPEEKQGSASDKVAGDDQSSAPTGKKDPAKTDKAPQASEDDEVKTDPAGKNDAAAGGQKSDFNDGNRPDDGGGKDDEDNEGGADDADGAKIGKKAGEENPDGDEGEDDNSAGKTNGDEIDGSSKSEVNLTPKIKDEPLGERVIRGALKFIRERDTSQPAGYGGPDGPHKTEYYDSRERDKKASWHYRNAGKNRHASLSKGIKHDYESELLRRGVKDSNGKQTPLTPPRLRQGPAFSHFMKKEETEMSHVDKVRASRLRTRALVEARDEQAQIQAFLDEGFPGSIPGEWYLDEEGNYHVAILGEDGLKDFVFEKHIGFKKLEGELGHEKGVKNPGALAAYIGRKKYGGKKMARAAKEHKAL